eukprot:7386945-Prymnesium_polylepis.1
MSYVKDDKELGFIGSLVLDMIAVQGTHEDAVSQSGQKGEKGTYILSHSKKTNDGRSNAKWYNAGMKAAQQLEWLDTKHGMCGELVEHFDKVPTPLFHVHDVRPPHKDCGTQCH